MNAVKLTRAESARVSRKSHLSEVIGFPAEAAERSPEEERLSPLEKGVLWLFSLLFVMMLVTGPSSLFTDLLGIGLLGFIGKTLAKHCLH